MRYSDHSGVASTSDLIWLWASASGNRACAPWFEVFVYHIYFMKFKVRKDHLAQLYQLQNFHLYEHEIIVWNSFSLSEDGFELELSSPTSPGFQKSFCNGMTMALNL